MRIALVSALDPANVLSSSGTLSHLYAGLSDQSIEVLPVGPLRSVETEARLALGRSWRRLSRSRWLPDLAAGLSGARAKVLTRDLESLRPDLVLSLSTVAFSMARVPFPTVFWPDAVVASLFNWYPSYGDLNDKQRLFGVENDRTALKNAAGVVFSSHWAAEEASQHYGLDPSRTSVVPYGANLSTVPESAELEIAIRSRSAREFRLVFIGVDWNRKGGDIALALAGRLASFGRRVVLSIVGCKAPESVSVPPGVVLKPFGFLSKAEPTGISKLNDILASSHFLLLPSNADCTPMVIGEAASWGVPTLSTSVGGIPEILLDQETGLVFPLGTPIDEQAATLYALLADPGSYTQMALSARHRFETHLNWSVAIEKVLPILEAAASA